MDAKIVFENISKTYTLQQNLLGVGIKNVLLHLPTILQAKNQKFEALHDISFEIKNGEAVGFIGANGAGKSTILSLIAQVLQPDRGKLVVRGRISPLLELGAGFHPEMTGKENIYLNAILLGMQSSEVTKKLASIIEFSELGNFISQPTRTYSTGMLARLGFSIAVHIEPEILLIDEILAVGDAHFQKKSYNKIMEFKKKDVTIVLVSHDLQAIESFCDKVIWLEKGRIVEMGYNVAEIVARYTQKYAT